MNQGRASGSDWKGAAFRRTLVGMVRKRVPDRDVEDIVQATLTEALSPSAPTDDGALQRWLIGVARHKIADRHRRGQRESFDLPEVPVDAPPHAENDLVRWAERALPAEGEEPHRTLEWMMREGDGEKLETIAESEQIPAPRVRKRVSRLRRHLRAEWKKEVALLAALGIVAVLIWLAHRPREPVAHDRLRPVPEDVTPRPATSAPLAPASAPVPSVAPSPPRASPPSPSPSASFAPTPSPTSTPTAPAPRKTTGHGQKAAPSTGSSM
jgi:DNA-directed RNA polymerase specialized sigma24 family protein